jgi:hypothetical protein
MAEESKAALPEREWAAFAAIDWADQKHVWRLVLAGSQRQESGQMDNTPEAVDNWAADLQQRFGGRPVAVCLEQSRGALVYMLSKYPHLILFPVHPNTAAQYRQTFAPSGAKDDDGDAASMLDLLTHHRDQLRVLEPDTVETRMIQFLAEERRRVVEEKTAQSNRLKANLKLYYPQILQWFSDVTTPVVGDLLERWPRLEDLQRSHPGTLRKFFHQHNCRGEQRIDERVRAIYEAMAATHDEAVLRACVLIVHGLVVLIEKLRSNIAALDQQLAELLAAHPDGAIFTSLPGAGKVLAPRMIAALGTQRHRFEDAYEIQCYSGIAPVTIASGKNRQVHCRWACPKFLRQTFHEFAEHSIGQSQWAQAYHQHLCNDEHKDHQVAVRALAYKWIRIIYRCWKDRKPYNEEIYLESLRRRGALMKGCIPSATAGQWTDVAGFRKFSERNA